MHREVGWEKFWACYFHRVFQLSSLSQSPYSLSSIKAASESIYERYNVLIELQDRCREFRSNNVLKEGPGWCLDLHHTSFTAMLNRHWDLVLTYQKLNCLACHPDLLWASMGCQPHLCSTVPHQQPPYCLTSCHFPPPQLCSCCAHKPFQIFGDGVFL